MRFNTIRENKILAKISQFTLQSGYALITSYYAIQKVKMYIAQLYGNTKGAFSFFSIREKKLLRKNQKK